MSNEIVPTNPERSNDARRMAALAESALKFRRATQDAIDDLTCDMVLDNAPMGGIKFHTPGGRNAMLVMAIGDDAVGKLTDTLADMVEPDTEPDPSKPNKTNDDPYSDPDWWKKGKA